MTGRARLTAIALIFAMLPTAGLADDYLTRIQDVGIKELERLLGALSPARRSELKKANLKLTAMYPGHLGCISPLNLASTSPTSSVTTLCPYAISRVATFVTSAELLFASRYSVSAVFNSQKGLELSDELLGGLQKLWLYYLKVASAEHHAAVTGDTSPTTCLAEQAAYAVAHNLPTNECLVTSKKTVAAWLHSIDQDDVRLLFTMNFHHVVQGAIAHELGHLLAPPQKNSLLTEVAADEFALDRLREADNAGTGARLTLPLVFVFWIGAREAGIKLDVPDHHWEARAEAGFRRMVCSNAVVTSKSPTAVVDELMRKWFTEHKAETVFKC